MFASCAKEIEFETPELPIDAPENGFVCSFAINDPQTKTTIEEGGTVYNIFWEEGDEITVHNGSKDMIFVADQKGATATFKAKTGISESDVKAFFQASKFTAKYGNADETSFTVTEGNAKHIPMSAPEITGREFTFSASKPVMAVKIPAGVTAEGIKITYSGGEGATPIATAKKDSQSSDITTFYIPVPVKNNESYEIFAYTDTDLTSKIAESMKMQVKVNLVAGEIYPFEFTPTLQIPTNTPGTYSLKSYPAKYNVRFTGDAGMDNVTVQYESGDNVEHPSVVDVNAKGLEISTFNIYAADSHVDIANGSATKLVSKTSNTTLVVKPSFTISTLTAQAGSVTVEGKVDEQNKPTGETNVSEIVLDYGSTEANMTGVVISVADVTSGNAVTITNNTTSVGEKKTPITVVGKEHSDSNSGGYTITGSKTQNIQVLSSVAAKIGDTVYETLAAAVGAAADYQTITLTDNLNLTAQQEIADKEITLDLAGYTIEYTGTDALGSGVLLVHNGAGLTVTGNGTIKSGTKANAAIALTKAGDNNSLPAKLTLENGKLLGKYYGITGNGSRPNTLITINGGSVEGQDATSNMGIYHPQVGTLTVNGGTIKGLETAIEMRAGNLVITDGTFTSTATSFSCNANGSGSTTKGAAIAIAQHSTKEDISVSISGGTFNGIKALNESNPESNDPTPQVTMSITGGTFNGEVSLTDVSKCISGGTFKNNPSTYVADGYKATENNKVWTIEPTGDVAKVGTTLYKDLHEALEAAKTAGTTCELLADVDLTGVNWTPIAGFGGTFDGKGHTISNLTVSGSGTDGFFGSISGATVKNLTIDKATVESTGDKVGILAATDGPATITNVNITNSTLKTSGEYAGAIFGHGYADIDGCQVTGCSIEAKDQVGAALGYMWVGYIQNCTVTGNTVHATDVRAGGLIGKFQVAKDNIGTDSASKMWVSNNTISGTITAANGKVGGIAGQIMGDDVRYEITNNVIDCPNTGCPIGTLREGQNATFTGSLESNITGNTWTKNTLDADKYTYSTSEVASGVSEQVIWNGQPSGIAKIGSNYYQNVKAAIEAVTSSESTVITMVADETVQFGDFANNVSGYYVISAGENITLDLNGKKITATSTGNSSHNLFHIANGGTFTIKDSAGNGTISYKYTGSHTTYTQEAVIYSNGDFNLNSGTLENVTEDNNSAGFVVEQHPNEWGDPYPDLNPTFHMTGGKLYSKIEEAVRLVNFGTSTNHEIVASMVMDGGEIEGWDAIFIQEPSYLFNRLDLTINAGTLKGQKSAIRVYTENPSGVVGSDNTPINININGGTYTSGKKSADGVVWLLDDILCVSNSNAVPYVDLNGTLVESKLYTTVSTTEEAQQALDNAKDCATIILKAGTYGTLLLQNTSNASNRVMNGVKIKAENNAEVKVEQIKYQSINQKSLDIENLVIDGISFTTDNNSDKSAVLFDVNGKYLRVNGLTIQNCSKVGKNSTGTTYDNAAFIGMYYDGEKNINESFAGDNTLTCGYHNIVIKNNSITSLYQPIKVPNSGPLYGLTIENNTFDSCSDNHMMLSSKTTGDILVKDNTINKMSGRFVRAADTQSGAKFIFKNNIVTSPVKYDSGGDGSIVKITGSAGFSVSETDNQWTSGSFTDSNKTTWIANGDSSKLVSQ